MSVDDLPAAPYLLGDGADAVLGAALAVEGGTFIAARPRQVLHRPGRSLAVRFEVEAVDRAGRIRRDALIACAHQNGPPQGALVVEADGIEIGVYRFPHDPALPGLPLVLDPVVAARLVQAGAPVHPVVRTYRPGHRAVVRLTADDGGTWWIKVLPPAEVGDAIERHRRISLVAPAPEVIAEDRRLGLLVLGHLPGRPLRDILTDPHAQLPDPTELLSLLHRLGDAGLDLPVGRASPIAAAHRHAALLAHAAPELGGRLQHLMDAIGPDVPAGSPVVVHGDLHPGQVLVAAGGWSVLDLDDAGLGDPVDDLACYLAHVACLVLDRPRSGLADHLRRLLGASEARRGVLGRRTAAALVGLATGPYRVQRPAWRDDTARRIELAELWVTGPPDELVLSGSS